MILGGGGGGFGIIWAGTFGICLDSFGEVSRGKQLDKKLITFL